MHQLQSCGVASEEDLDFLWKEFFKDPSNWWDNRSSKRSSRQPDFKHKLPKEPLWINSCKNPSRVNNELYRHGFTIEHCIGKEGASPSVADVFSPSIIWACCKNKDLLTGTRIHYELQKRGLIDKRYSDALVTMYAKCGELQKAQALLDMHKSSSVIPWTALIGSYAQWGEGQSALDCFKQMQHEGICPDAVTYMCVLKACAEIGDIDKGKRIHDKISRQGFLKHNTMLGGALVDMYAKCGALPQAQSVLEKLPSRNLNAWNALIGGYAQKGHGQKALKCYEKMKGEGVPPNVVTYVCILKACAVMGDIKKGKQFHDEISRLRLLEHSIVLGGALVDMYAKCGALSQAQSILKNLPSRNIVSWNALIGGYAQNGQSQQALDCFEQMQHEGISPDAVTYVCVLKACALIGTIDKGKQIHDEILRQGLLKHSILVGNALVDMYVKCGDLPHAQRILKELPSRNVVSWSALIAGYAQQGQGQQALECYEQMQQEGVSPDAVTYVSTLKSCAMMRAIDKGVKLHSEILRWGLLEHSIVLGGALVDMYAKCGALLQARIVLENLPSRDVALWNNLIVECAQNEQGQQALECFEQMQHEGISPDAVTYVGILKACAVIGAIGKGKQTHDEILRRGLLEHNIVLGGALVDMYAKCGALSQAQSVLEKLPVRNVVLWNVLITGYAQEGEGEQALECFEQMERDGILPDIVTFRCLLNVCSHLGHIEKGQALFDTMVVTYDLKLDIECFTCMVDLLGRAGHLVKAVELIEQMPVSANSAIFISLLGACRKWVDVNVGIWAFEHAMEQDKCDGAAYVLMANIFAAAGMPEKARDIEAMRIKNKAWKLQGCGAWTDSRTRGFCVG